MSKQWPETLEDKSLLDAPYYKIAIKNKDFKQVFKFIGKYPDNIYKLTETIEEVKNYGKNNSINQ